MSESKPLLSKDIKPKMKFEGKVTKIELAGARIDIGADQDAFLHISQITADRPVTRVADVLAEGGAVTVWVKQVKPQQNLIALTMIEPPALDWGDLQRRMKLTGKVVRVEDFGAICQLPWDHLCSASRRESTEPDRIAIGN